MPVCLPKPWYRPTAQSQHDQGLDPEACQTSAPPLCRLTNPGEDPGPSMDPVHANPLVVLGRKLPLVDEPRHELDGPEFMLIIESLKLVPRDDQLQRG
jgi:hypothetical protein